MAEGFNENINIIVAKEEADVMCGSLKKSLDTKYGRGKTIIKSTDSDLMVHSYPSFMFDVSGDCIVNTKKLFQCISCSDPAALCVNLCCDYNEGSQTLLTADFEEYLKYDPTNSNDRDRAIYTIFTKPWLIENNFELKYEKPLEEVYATMKSLLPNAVNFQYEPQTETVYF